MRAYSMDLRERALLDSDAGMKAADVAAKYRVSGSWVRLLKQRRRETGEVAPRVQRPGRRGMREPPLHTLAALMAAHPDRTLAELKDALATPASVPTVWRAVRASRPQPSLCLRGGPARSSSADRSRPAWLSSGAWHVGRCATAQSTPDTPDRRSESPRCDVALARQSTGLSGADGQCHAPRRPELAGSRSLPAPQRTGSEPIGAPS